MNKIIKKENFVDEFITHFLPNVSKRKLKKLRCYPPHYGYLWMVCEQNLVENLKGKNAMVAYDQQDKIGAIEMQYDNGFMGDDVTQVLSEENNTSKKIQDSRLREFYVIGRDFSWCYIVTHEPFGCGPYFIKRNK